MINLIETDSFVVSKRDFKNDLILIDKEFDYEQIIDKSKAEELIYILQKALELIIQTK